jgi:hypothetical protein
MFRQAGRFERQIHLVPSHLATPDGKQLFPVFVDA